MHQYWAAGSTTILIYVAGFLGPITASRWKALALRFTICLAITIGLAYFVTRFDLLFAAMFMYPILLFAAGVVSGSATRAALLGLRWNARTVKGVLAIALGLLALPAIAIARLLYP